MSTNDESALYSYQKEWREDLDRTGFVFSWYNLREDSTRYLKEEEKFYKNPKRTEALDAAVSAFELAFNKYSGRDKKLTMSSNIIPFDEVRLRGKKMSSVAETKKQELDLPSRPQMSDMSNPFSSVQTFEGAQRMAKALSMSTLIPTEYQNNIPNCLIALEISQRLRASALMVMQNLYIVHGKPGWSAQYIISAINSCGKFSPLRFKFDDAKNPSECQAYAIEIKTGEVLHGDNITLEMVKAEGWLDKKGSKWKTMPGQMFRYRAASFFGKVYAPEILMGFQTQEEIEDIVPEKKVKEVQSHIVSDTKLFSQNDIEQMKDEAQLSVEEAKEDRQPATGKEMPWDKYLDGYQGVK